MKVLTSGWDVRRRPVLWCDTMLTFKALTSKGKKKPCVLKKATRTLLKQPLCWLIEETHSQAFFLSSATTFFLTDCVRALAHAAPKNAPSRKSLSSKLQHVTRQWRLTGHMLFAGQFHFHVLLRIAAWFLAGGLVVSLSFCRSLEVSGCGLCVFSQFSLCSFQVTRRLQRMNSLVYHRCVCGHFLLLYFKTERQRAR